MTQMTQQTRSKKHHNSQVACHIKIRKKDTISPYVSTRPDVDQDTARSRTFFIRTYLKPEAFTELFPSCQAWAYILHDKDDKAPHYHILMAYQNQHFLSAEAKEFHQLAERFPIDGQPQSTFIEIAHKKAFCFAYLTHSDPQSLKAEKHRYSDSEVFGENLSFFADDVHSKSRYNVVDVLDDINNAVSYREMATKYGTNFVCQYSRFKSYAQALYHEERNIARDKIGQTLRDYADGYADYRTLFHAIIEHEAYKNVFNPPKNLQERLKADADIRKHLAGLQDEYLRAYSMFKSVLDENEAINDLVEVAKSTEPPRPLDVLDHLKEVQRDCADLDFLNLPSATKSKDYDKASKKIIARVKARVKEHVSNER